jgi:hypothetical protein
MKDSARIHRSS